MTKIKIQIGLPLILILSLAFIGSWVPNNNIIEKQVKIGDSTSNYPELGACFECIVDGTRYYLVTLETSKKDHYVNMGVISQKFNTSIGKDSLLSSKFFSVNTNETKPDIFGLIVYDIEFNKFYQH